MVLSFFCHSFLFAFQDASSTNLHYVIPLLLAFSNPFFLHFSILSMPAYFTHSHFIAYHFAFPWTQVFFPDIVFFFFVHKCNYAYLTLQLLVLLCRQTPVARVHFITLTTFHIEHMRSCLTMPNFIRHPLYLSLIHIWRCRRIERCRSRWSPYH